jgi:hypothetical protein
VSVYRALGATNSPSRAWLRSPFGP